ncbi:uncharacterized [Tachysurus ichikawai]
MCFIDLEMFSRRLWRAAAHGMWSLCFSTRPTLGRLSDFTCVGHQRFTAVFSTQTHGVKIDPLMVMMQRRREPEVTSTHFYTNSSYLH